MKKIILFFRLFLVALLFLSPFLCSKGGKLAMVARGEVKIGAVDKVVLVHVHPLRIGGPLPLFADSPARAGAPKPYPFACFFGGEGSLRGCQSLLFFFWGGDVRVVGGRRLRLYVVP